MRRPPLAAPAFVLLAALARAQSLAVGDGDGSITIERMAVEATVDAGVARVEVDQTFRNGGARAEEGLYRFLLPDDAVIGSFSMWMEGKEKQGRILDSQDARQIYDRIVRSKRDPGLLEQVGWREFRVNVFPIPANDVVRVRLSYAHVVRDDGAMESLEVPLPASAVGELRVHASVAADPAITAIDCPYPRGTAVAEAPSDGRFDVACARRDFTPTGPFVVRALTRRREGGAAFDVTLLAHRPPGDGGESGWFVARIVPRFAAAAATPTIARDLVFVVDCSGSMTGSKIEQARAALAAGLATLEPCDRFDVVTFANATTSLGGGRLLDATPENLERARLVARNLDASGLTNLDGALTTALASRSPDPDRFSAIVLLTDGDPTEGITNPTRILAHWTADRGATRLFAFGVGNDVKDYLLTRLAREGRGDARYVADGASLEFPLATLFDRVRTPLLIDPTLEVDAAPVVVHQQEPRLLPDLFAGRALVVSGRYDGSGRATFRLRGRSEGREVVLDVPLDFPADTPERPHVAQLWAKSRIARLIDDLRAGDSGAAQGELVAEIRGLGLRHQLVTPYTSFLVLEDSAQVASGAGTGERERVPGVGDDDQVLSGATDGTPIGVGAAGHHGTGVPSAFASRRAGGGGLGQGGGGGRGSGKGGAALPTSATLDSSDADVLLGLVWLQRHQEADGSWDAHDFGAKCAGGDAATCDSLGPADHAVESTGLALLAFLGHGDTLRSGPFRKWVDRGVTWLLANQRDDGLLAAREAPDAARQHAIAALALVELEAMTRDDARLPAPAKRAVDAALALRAADGAWRRADGSLDLEATAWMALLLRSAAVASLDVDETALTKAAAALAPFCDAATGAVTLPAGASSLAGDAATAAALLVHLLAPSDDAATPFVAAATLRLTSRPSRQGADSPRHDPVGWHFTAFALALHDGRDSPRLRQERADGGDLVQRDKRRCTFGSSQPQGPEATRLGRLQSTLLLTLADLARLRVTPQLLRKR